MMNKDLVGQTLLGQFRVDAFVESGGMAAVYRVWDLKRNVSLAMKVLHADLADEPEVLKRFRREADALKKLTHPHIVPFYGMYQDSGSIFLLERFVDGLSLKDIIRKQQGKPLGIHESLIYLKTLCASLGYAHANGMVHCDVKPGNVMIDLSGSIYLTDFGIARYSESTTTSLGVAGTPAYMAPEQIRGETVSAATDVYALGVMLFELLTGQRPFRGTESSTESGGKTTNERIRYGHLKVPPPDPRSINPEISENIAKAILRSLNKKPIDRFQNTQEFFDTICLASDRNFDDVPDRIMSLGQSASRNLIINQAVPTVSVPVSSKSNKKAYPLLLSTGTIVLFIWIVAQAGMTTRPNTPPLFVPTRITAVFSPTSIPISPTKTKPPQTQTPTIPTPTQPLITTSCPGAASTRIHINDLVEVVTTDNDRLFLRSLPEINDGTKLERLNKGTQLKIFDGPYCAKDPKTGINFWFWEVKVKSTGRMGFVAEGEPALYYLKKIR